LAGLVESHGQFASLDIAILAADFFKLLICDPFVDLSKEKDAIVGVAADFLVIGRELDLVCDLATNVVGHSDLRVRSAVVDGEGGKSCLLILEVHICHAVDGEEGRDVLGHVVLNAHWALEEYATDWSILFEHGAYLTLLDIIG